MKIETSQYYPQLPTDCHNKSPWSANDDESSESPQRAWRCARTDKFRIPGDTSAEDKTALMGVVFLAAYTFFEQDQGMCHSLTNSFIHLYMNTLSPRQAGAPSRQKVLSSACFSATTYRETRSSRRGMGSLSRGYLYELMYYSRTLGRGSRARRWGYSSRDNRAITR